MRPSPSPEDDRREAVEEEPEDEVDAIRARIDRIESAIAERDDEIAELDRTSAERDVTRGLTPMEQHAHRVRELQATLAAARAERDAVRAQLPQTSSAAGIISVFGVILILGLFIRFFLMP